MVFSEERDTDAPLEKAAEAAMKDVLFVKRKERVLIISNPSHDVREISMALFDAAVNRGALPVLMFQSEKGQFDLAEEEIISALSSNPDVVISISKDRLGKDRHGMKKPYTGRKTKRKFDHIFDMLYEEARTRSFWSPGTTVEMFSRTVPIDYTQLRSDCKRVAGIIAASEEVRVTSESGTDITLSVKGRKPRLDDGDFRRPGRAGNLPSGEVYVSPALGTANGTIAFDGSIVVNDGELVLKKPIMAEVEDGFVRRISGGPDAAKLERSVKAAERKARAMLSKGEISKAMAGKYEKNARNIGELGIGLNRMARIVGNMLEDEKVYGTCHFAIGENYDGDALALIHLDGLVRSPTIVSRSGDGRSVKIMSEGGLAWNKLKT